MVSLCYLAIPEIKKGVQNSFVPEAGLEPARPQWPRDFKSLVSTSSTTRAEFSKKISPALGRSFLERKTGFEPATLTLARLCSTN